MWLVKVKIQNFLAPTARKTQRGELILPVFGNSSRGWGGRVRILKLPPLEIRQLGLAIASTLASKAASTLTVSADTQVVDR